MTISPDSSPRFYYKMKLAATWVSINHPGIWAKIEALAEHKYPLKRARKKESSIVDDLNRIDKIIEEGEK